DLMRVGWNDWTEAAARALDELYECTGKPAIVAGLSLGSLLATHLAANFGSRVAGLAVMANATRLSLASRAPLWIFDVTRPFGNAFFMPKAGADIRDPSARERHLTYDVNPIKSAIEVMRAGRVVSAELGRVTCPTLVIHGRFDRVCPVANARRFADGLGTKDVEVRIMANSGHIVTSDWDRGDVARRLDAFLSRTAHVPRP
ncbi:MAG TPA: alpha/beta fold hydrolase, partial [Polyangiaceae bacterium]|nr:alpha/beta fold hydrolase [Polyangiaceae bacterium]